MSEQERRVRLMASSSIVGGDIQWLIDEMDRLRAQVPPAAPAPDALTDEDRAALKKLGAQWDGDGEWEEAIASYFLAAGVARERARQAAPDEFVTVAGKRWHKDGGTVVKESAAPDALVDKTPISQGSPVDKNPDLQGELRTPSNDLVICPNCVHEFRAIPVNVQADMREAADALAALTAERDEWRTKATEWNDPLGAASIAYHQQQLAEERATKAEAALAATTQGSLGMAICNCGNYRPGSLTGGWQCQVHGQQW